MGLPTNEEQQEILDWYEKQRGGVTTSVKKALGSWAAEVGLIALLMNSAKDADKAREDAEKAWRTTEKLRRQLQRAYSAANSAYQMDVKE